MTVVVAVGEIQANIWFVVAVLKVINPASGIGEDVYDIGVDKVKLTLQWSCDGLTYDSSVIVDKRCVLADCGVCRGYGVISVVIACSRVEAVAALGSLGEIVNLITIVHLPWVEFLLACDRVDAINTLDGSLLVLAWVFPRDIPAPVKVWSDGIAIFVLLNFKLFVASIGRVGESLTDNRIAHPVYKLLVFAVGDFVLVHPEGVDTHTASSGVNTP